MASDPESSGAESGVDAAPEVGTESVVGRPQVAAQYRVLHSAISAGVRGEVVTFEDSVDVGRLLSLGAIEPVKE
jgi:hypothetical protein